MRFIVAAAAVLAIPAAVQAQVPDPADHVYLDQDWKPDELTSAVLRTCRIPAGFWSVEKEDDGTAMVQASLSLSPAEKACADEMLKHDGRVLAPQ